MTVGETNSHWNLCATRAGDFSIYITLIMEIYISILLNMNFKLGKNL
jgi:hypothetical protein